MRSERLVAQPSTLFFLLGFILLVSPAQSQSLPSSPADTLLRIHETSLDEQPGYTSFAVEYPNGEEETVWIGDPVLTIHPHQVRRLSTERDHRGDVLTLQLDRETSKQYTSLTEDFVGKHLAFSIAGEVIQAPRVLEPIVGDRIPLFDVPDSLLSAYLETAPHALDEKD